MSPHYRKRQTCLPVDRLDADTCHVRPGDAAALGIPLVQLDRRHPPRGVQRETYPVKTRAADTWGTRVRGD